MNILTDNNLDLSHEKTFYSLYCEESVQIVKFSISWDQPVSLGVGVVQTKQVDKVFSPWGRQGAKTSIAISRYCLSTIFDQILRYSRYHIRYCLSTIFIQVLPFSQCLIKHYHKHNIASDMSFYSIQSASAIFTILGFSPWGATMREW